MAIQFADFPSGQEGLYGDVESYMLNGIYAQIDDIALVEDPDPSVTGKVARAGGVGAAPGTLRRVLSTPNATAGMAVRLWPSNLGEVDGASWFMAFKDVGNIVHVYIDMTTTGVIRAYRGPGDFGTTLLGQSSGPVIVANAWQHVEVKVVISDTVGSVEVRVEGVTVLDLSGIDTAATANVTVDQVTLGSRIVSTKATTPHYKDFVLWDGAGSNNTTFLGSVSVRDLITSADVSFNWGASTGSTGFNLVDDFPPNDDTDYIYAIDPPPAASTMSLTDLPADVSSVKGLIIFNRSKKTDGGDGNLQMGLISGASTALGADRAITTAYTWWTDVVELDPATSAAWLPAAVNAVTLRFNRTV